MNTDQTNRSGQSKLNTPTTGDWIKRYRRAAGMTQIELARATGKTQATISRWESGQEAIFVNDIEQMVELFRQKGLNPEPPPRLTANTPQVLVRGYISEGCAVTSDPDRVDHVAAPEGFGHLTLDAYRIGTDTLPVLARETLLFTERRAAGEPFDDAVGALSIVSTPERGTLLGFPRPAARGRFFVERPTGRAIETAISTAAPVLLILPRA